MRRFVLGTIAHRLAILAYVLFALFPAFGVCNAATTMVGQALGAGKPERAERAVYVAGAYATAFLGSIDKLPQIVAQQEDLGLCCHATGVLAALRAVETT